MFNRFFFLETFKFCTNFDEYKKNCKRSFKISQWLIRRLIPLKSSISVQLRAVNCVNIHGIILKIYRNFAFPRIPLRNFENEYNIFHGNEVYQEIWFCSSEVLFLFTFSWSALKKAKTEHKINAEELSKICIFCLSKTVCCTLKKKKKKSIKRVLDITCDITKKKKHKLKLKFRVPLDFFSESTQREKIKKYRNF